MTLAPTLFVALCLPLVAAAGGVARVGGLLRPLLLALSGDRRAR